MTAGKIILFIVIYIYELKRFYLFSVTICILKHVNNLNELFSKLLFKYLVGFSVKFRVIINVTLNAQIKSN